MVDLHICEQNVPMTESTRSISVAELRAGLPHAFSRAAFGNERINIIRRGNIAAVLIGAEELELLERLDDQEDLLALRLARQEDDGVKKSLDEVLAANGVTR